MDIQDDCALTASRRSAAPQAADPKHRWFSGDEVELESIALDGKPLPASAYSVDAAELTLANVRPVH